jgi:hypothetical protein
MFAAHVAHVVDDDGGACPHPEGDRVERAFGTWADGTQVAHGMGAD